MEERDTARFRAWAVPSWDDDCLRTVCVTGRKVPDPRATGSLADAGTTTCGSARGGTAKCSGKAVPLKPLSGVLAFVM